MVSQSPQVAVMRWLAGPGGTVRFYSRWGTGSSRVVPPAMTQPLDRLWLHIHPGSQEPLSTSGNLLGARRNAFLLLGARPLRR